MTGAGLLGGGGGGAKAAKGARPWIERVARFGYAAYRLVYVLVGVLSVRAARLAGRQDRRAGGRAADHLARPAREGPARAGRPGSARVRDVAALPGLPRPGPRGRGHERPDQTRRPRRQRPVPRGPSGERRARGARVRRRGRRAGRLDATLLQQHLGRLLVGSSGPVSSPSASSCSSSPATGAYRRLRVMGSRPQASPGGSRDTIWR